MAEEIRTQYRNQNTVVVGTEPAFSDIEFQRKQLWDVQNRNTSLTSKNTALAESLSFRPLQRMFHVTGTQLFKGRIKTFRVLHSTDVSVSSIMYFIAKDKYVQIKRATQDKEQHSNGTLIFLETDRVGC